MIPKFNAYTKRNIDLRKIKWPGDILYEHDEGIPANHEYRNMTGFSWDCFLETYEAEVKYINDASRRSKTVWEFEDILLGIEERASVDIDPTFDYFNVGVASATVAVSALGCAPVSSCRAHPGWCEAEHPYVAFWAQKGPARIVRDVVNDLGIGGINWSIERENDGLLVYARNVLGMMKFGKGLYDRRNE